MITGNLTQPLTIVWNKNSSGRNFLKPWKAIKWYSSGGSPLWPGILPELVSLRIWKKSLLFFTICHNWNYPILLTIASHVRTLQIWLVGKLVYETVILRYATKFLQNSSIGLVNWCSQNWSPKSLSSREDECEVDIWWAIEIIWCFLTASPHLVFGITDSLLCGDQLDCMLQ